MAVCDSHAGLGSSVPGAAQGLHLLVIIPCTAELYLGPGHRAAHLPTAVRDREGNQRLGCVLLLWLLLPSFTLSVMVPEQ